MPAVDVLILGWSGVLLIGNEIVMHIVHLTSVHARNDVRIFIKQCRSLVANNYAVSLIVADGKGNDVIEGVNIVDAGIVHGRINRMLKSVWRVFRLANRLSGDVYHLHDPELIPIGLRLKSKGKRVLFDAHEDVPKQLLSKPYLGPTLLRFLACAFSIFEGYACRRLDGIIAATPSIREKFLKINPNTIDINNFPILNELDSGSSRDGKQPEVCYVGGISSIRGIREITKSLHKSQTSVRLNLVGSFSEPEVEAEVKALPGWQRINEKGYLDRNGVRDVLGRSVAGLVILHPLVNFLEALPIKMFEYMSAGLPVIASNFPLWREIIEGESCGLCVDPLDPTAIANAIDDLIIDREKARRMGENGRNAVMARYNWSVEEKKLLSFYSSLLQRPSK